MKRALKAAQEEGRRRDVFITKNRDLGKKVKQLENKFMQYQRKVEFDKKVELRKVQTLEQGNAKVKAENAELEESMDKLKHRVLYLKQLPQQKEYFEIQDRVARLEKERRRLELEVEAAQREVARRFAKDLEKEERALCGSPGSPRSPPERDELIQLLL